MDHRLEPYLLLVLAQTIGCDPLIDPSYLQVPHTPQLPFDLLFSVKVMM